MIRLSPRQRQERYRWNGGPTTLLCGGKRVLVADGPTRPVLADRHRREPPAVVWNGPVEFGPCGVAGDCGLSWLRLVPCSTVDLVEGGADVVGDGLLGGEQVVSGVDLDAAVAA